MPLLGRRSRSRDSQGIRAEPREPGCRAYPKSETPRGKDSRWSTGGPPPVARGAGRGSPLGTSANVDHSAGAPSTFRSGTRSPRPTIARGGRHGTSVSGPGPSTSAAASPSGACPVGIADARAVSRLQREADAVATAISRRMGNWEPRNSEQAADGLHGITRFPLHPEEHRVVHWPNELIGRQVAAKRALPGVEPCSATASDHAASCSSPRTFPTAGLSSSRPTRLRNKINTTMLIITGRESLAASVPLNRFAIRLATAIGERGNVVFSPHSIASLLAFLHRVSSGETASEIERGFTLHTELDVSDLPRYLEEMPLAIDDVEVLSGSRCWVDAAWIAPETLLAVSRRTTIEPSHFSDPVAVANEVNAWVREVTRGIITNVLGPTDISPESRMLLCTALYLKASWFLQFPPEATSRGVFHGLHGEGPAMMMENTVFALYQADEMAEYVEVPYAGAASFRIVLPRPEVELGEVWRHLAEVSTFGRAAVAPPCDRFKLRLPRFTIDWRSGLAATLKSLGVRRVFSAEAADFSPIAARGTLFAADVLHRAMIRVCEAGTEAGAGTATQFTGSLYFSPPPVIEVNRPFIFDVVEHATAGVLLCGQVTEASPNTFPDVVA